jgi:hypothetical protein
VFAKKLCDLFGGETEIRSCFEEYGGTTVFLGDEGLEKLAGRREEGKESDLVFGMVALTSGEEFIENGVDVGSKVRKVRALGADEVCVNSIELLVPDIVVFFRHDDWFLDSDDLEDFKSESLSAGKEPVNHGFM